jgi:hypothetical protein
VATLGEQSAHQGSQSSTGALELEAVGGPVDERGMSLAVSELGAGISELLRGMDINNLSLRQFRRMLSRHFGLGKNGLEARAVEVNALVRAALDSMAVAPQTLAQQRATMLDDLGNEDVSVQSTVYLVTFSRVLLETVASTDYYCRDRCYSLYCRSPSRP